MPNKLKIGYTNRDVRERMAELNTTGVPDEFKLEFSVEVEEAQKFEQFIHKKLKKYWHNYEFFSCNIRTAVETIKNEIEGGAWVTGDISGVARNTFITENEKKAILEVNEKNRLIQEKKKSEEQERLRKQQETQREVESVYPFWEQKYSSVYQMIYNYTTDSENIAFAIARTIAVPLIGITIVGAGIADWLDRDHLERYQTGQRIGRKKLSSTEKKLVLDLYSYELNLERKNILQPLFYNHNKRVHAKYAIRWYQYGLLLGAYNGIGLDEKKMYETFKRGNFS